MKVKPLATFRVVPVLPDALRGLKDLAYNYLWTWNYDLAMLFRELDLSLWETTGHNPARMLREIAQERLQEAVNSPQFFEHYQHCLSYQERYLSEPSWYDKTCSSAEPKQIVYFSMEYGINECLPVYSGGLGVLSGDHLKSASDLGLPLVGIGLAYREGYFQQQLSLDGTQSELYPQNDFTLLPITPVLDEKGEKVKVFLSFPGRKVYIGVWKAQVGRIPLYLLDSDQPENSEADREITHTLYGGDKETRIQQELVLGMGGIEVATRLGIKTAVCHMNEGHSAFIQLSRISRAIKEQKLTLPEAIQLIATGTVFTTHTPVPAGIDQFSSELMDKYLSHLYGELGIPRSELLAMGSRKPGAPGELFNMAIFALRTADHANGVSRLHADVSRGLWEESWPSLPHDEIPISYVTNGIHLRTWTSDTMSTLFDRHLGPDWRRAPDDKAIWAKVREIPDEELWHAHVTSKERLIQFVRHRTAEHRARTAGLELGPEELMHFLDPHVLTIGFARRFATYKRATLLLRHPQRLLSMLRNEEHPMQIIFAGKAHPQDEEGKALIRNIIHFARAEGVEHRLIFLENYDMTVARYLVQGVDVWLNNPRRPLEASGTSGMKVLGNGGMNLSILDGWWDEAYFVGLGWAIGQGQDYTDGGVQDERDAQSLYDVLEKQIVPLFYNHENGKIPRRWIARMKDSIAELTPRFNAHRMVKEYCQDFYQPAYDRNKKMTANNLAGIHQLTEWKQRVTANWRSVKISQINAEKKDSLATGSELEISATVNLGSLSPGDIEVQVYYGPLLPDGSIGYSNHESMEVVPNDKEFLVRAKLSFAESGRYGYTVRIVPSHPLLGNPLRLGLVCWGDMVHFHQK